MHGKKHMQTRAIASGKRSAILTSLCMCFLCALISSCISLPGEKELEEKNLAAEYYEIALKYMDVKQYDKAISCFQKAKDKSGEAMVIDYQMARCYALSNKWSQAAEMYEMLLESDTDNSTLKENYAYTLYKSGQKEKALQLYAELCELNDGNERLAQNYESLYKEAYPPEDEPESEDDAAVSETEAEEAEQAVSEE